MLEGLITRCLAFLDITLDELRDWFRKQRLPLQITILSVVGILVAGITFESEIIDNIGRVRALLWVSLHTEMIPISSMITETVRPIADELTRRLDTEIEEGLKNDTVAAWPLAQAIVATSGPGFSRQRSADVVNYIRKRADALRCACWSEFDRPPDPVMPVASGYILWAYATMRVRPTDAEIEYVLRTQRPDGAWPIFDLTGDANVSSTWSTVIMMVGLHAVVERDLVDAVRKAAIIARLQRARTWLLSIKGSQHLWTYHPSIPQSKTSEALSAMAIFALIRTNVAPITSHDDLVRAREWLERTSIAPISLNEVESNLIDIKGSKGELLFNDHFQQVPVPWTIAACSSLYSKVSLVERAKILRFLESQLSPEELRDAVTIDPLWWRAELLVALNYVLAKAGPNPVGT